MIKRSVGGRPNKRCKMKDSFYGRMPEYPNYFHGHEDRLVQADWMQDDARHPSYIKHKPNVVLSLNNIIPDEDGNLDISASDLLRIGGIPNQTLFLAVEEIFEETLDYEE